MSHTENQIQDLMDRFASEVSTPVSDAPQSTRRARIVEDAPAGICRVNIAGIIIDVPDNLPIGEAVLVALGIGKAEGIAGLSGNVFMWNYSVTVGSDTYRGQDKVMRAALESARINKRR